MNAEPATSVDGRRARRDQNRERVVDAMLELYREGELRPSLAAVAERSGVSHRSVFRYFEDLDELCRVAIERQWASIAHLWELPAIGEGSLADRIDALVEQRLTIYDVAAPVSRVGHMRAPTEPVLLENQRANARESVRQIAAHFAAELAGLDDATSRTLTEAVAVAVCIETIETLRFLRELDRDDAADVMATTLTRLLRP